MIRAWVRPSILDFEPYSSAFQKKLRRAHSKKIYIVRSLAEPMRIVKLLVLVLFLQSCDAQPQEKINGVSYVGSRQKVTEGNIHPLVSINANYASVMPFGFIRSLDNPNIIYNTQRQWYGETREGAKQYIDMLRTKGIKIMLKPQIWIWRGEFTGYLSMKTEEDWKVLEDSYRAFILEYAELAEETQTEIYCIGTELEQFIVNRPEFWNKLIKDIKAVYNGKLTYAANWDEYKRVPFWNKLDYVGVDAYFPVSESKTPSKEEALKGWEPWKKELQSVSEKAGKPILFAEFGYRSVDYAGKEPWRSDRSMNIVNLEAQSNLSKALFESVWGEDWFAGGFIWKWFIDHQSAGGSDNPRFTPQNKPTEDVIRSHYSSYR